MEILSRNVFGEIVYGRDKGRCVVCGEEGTEVHHIFERKLFEPVSRSYLAANGATVCSGCHRACEQCGISPADLYCRITGTICDSEIQSFGSEFGWDLIYQWQYDILRDTNVTLLYGYDYGEVLFDKWGNACYLYDGRPLRAPGPLYPDCYRKMDAKAQAEFAKYVKYPRTYHLPWSPNLQNDDRVIDHLDKLRGYGVVITDKMDGENTTMYNDHIHARSLDSGAHPSRDWVRALHGRIAHDIPEDMRICGENMFAVHSIEYSDLEDYFYVFNIWRDDVCLGWDDTLEWCELLGLTPTPEIWRGIWDTSIEWVMKHPDLGDREGYVVRRTEQITIDQWATHAAKYVRKNHVQTDEHWLHQEMRINGLRS